jgi:hypothetical protein
MGLFKKGDKVDYGPFKGAKVTNPEPNRYGRIEIETKNGTSINVPSQDVKKTK